MMNALNWLMNMVEQVNEVESKLNERMAHHIHGEFIVMNERINHMSAQILAMEERVHAASIRKIS